MAVAIAPMLMVPAVAAAQDGERGRSDRSNTSVTVGGGGVSLSASERTRPVADAPARSGSGSGGGGGVRKASSSGSAGSGSSGRSGPSGPPSGGALDELYSAGLMRALDMHRAAAEGGPAVSASMQDALTRGAVTGSDRSWPGVNNACGALSASGGAPGLCQSSAAPQAAQQQGPAAPAPPPVDPAAVAREAAMRMHLPESRAKVGPDPSINEWNMAAVGYPLWLWTDSPGQQQQAMTEQGITLELAARRTKTVFSMGDGGSRTCTTTRRWSRSVKPGSESPVCGYTYQKPSLPKGKYQVAATEHWEVTWTALGQSGVVQVEQPGPATALPVGELQALNVPAGSSAGNDCKGCFSN